MEVRKKLVVNTPEAQWILDKRLTSGSLAIEIAMLKLTKFYEIVSKKQAVYGYITLSNILNMIYKTRHLLQNLVKEFESVLAKQKIDRTAIQLSDTKIYELRIGVPLCGELVSLIELYDRLNCSIKIAGKFNLFKKRTLFFKSMNKCHRHIVGVISIILSVDEEKISRVSIDQYLDQSKEYLEAAESMGEITPSTLYATLNIDMFPRMPAVTRNPIIHKLKHME